MACGGRNPKTERGLVRALVLGSARRRRRTGSVLLAERKLLGLGGSLACVGRGFGGWRGRIDDSLVVVVFTRRGTGGDAFMLTLRDVGERLALVASCMLG